MFFTILGYIAAFLTTISFLPQAVKTIQSKDTKGISFLMYLMFSTGVFLWFIYGLFIKDIPLSLANFITFIFAMIILINKIINMKKGEK